jgi:iron complex outermembrane recepter protein
MKSALFTFMLALFSCLVSAQEISGLVRDDQGKSLQGASAALKKAKDSSIVKLSLTTAAGRYEFPSIGKGKYFIEVSFVGHGAGKSEVFEFSGSGNKTMSDIKLTKTTSNLKEVTVISKKPIIEVKADRTVLNVEGSVNAVGQDALELLRKSPGVTVDRDDNLSISGKNGVQVYIDGRPTPLTGKDLSDYLKTIQSSSIESIEIITNPSAKYDAAGNAGIINIKLRKNRSFGTNGSATAGYSIGIYPKYNAGLSLNHRNKKFNIFGNYSYNRNHNESFMNLYRIQLDTLFDQRSNMEWKGNNHNFKAGADYFLNKKSTVGVMFNGTFNDNEFGNLSKTPISYVPTGVVDRILVANNRSNSNRENLNANINYRFADTSGKEFNMDGDYGRYKIRSDQMQPNFYFDPGGNLFETRIYNMIAPTDIDIYTLKADYEQGFKKGKLGIGAKTSFVRSINDFQRYNVYVSGKDLDTLRSNGFKYRENINAVYVNYNKPFKGFIVQAGLRVENTNAEGISDGYHLDGNGYDNYDSSFTRNYTDVFPSAAITFNKKPKHQWNLTYSRRIDRPAYQDLNPFEFKLDEYTYQKGNTDLRPQYTNSVGLSYTYNYKLTTALNYSHVKDVFTMLIDTAEKSKSFITKKNLARQDIVSLNVSYPFQYKWLSVFGNLNSYYSHYLADFGPGRTVDLDVFAFNIYMQSSAKLGKDWTAEISGWYTSPSIWQGTFKSKEMWSVDAGIQKGLFKGKASVKASVSDIFQSMRWGGTSDFAGQYLHASGGWESRLFKLFFTYHFGSSQIKAERQRKTGLEDENKRIGSQGGGISN